jgi:hypothetical protein
MAKTINYKRNQVTSSGTPMKHMEKAINKDYQETSKEVSQIPNGTSDNPDIQSNSK